MAAPLAHPPVKPLPLWEQPPATSSFSGPQRPKTHSSSVLLQHFARERQQDCRLLPPPLLEQRGTCGSVKPQGSGTALTATGCWGWPWGEGSPSSLPARPRAAPPWKSCCPLSCCYPHLCEAFCWHSYSGGESNFFAFVDRQLSLQNFSKVSPASASESKKRYPEITPKLTELCPQQGLLLLLLLQQRKRNILLCSQQNHSGRALPQYKPGL